MTLDEFIRRLEGVSGGGDQYYAKCPAHDDGRASLSVARRNDGGAIVNCHAGCTPEEITAALGLTIHDLYNTTAEQDFRAPVIARYDYRDADGKLIAQKLRRADKSFIWRQPGGAGGWTYNRKGITVPPYNLPAVLAAERVYIVEGEKDVDALAAQGWAAPCGADGAGKGKWRDHYTDWFQGKTVTVIQDNDDIGKAFAEETAAAVSRVAKSVKVLDLCKIWPELPEHGDTSDILTHLGAVAGMKAIAKLSEESSEYRRDSTNTNGNAHSPVLVKASDVPYEPPRWLIVPYFQRGKGTIIQADSGVGKTAFMCAIAAHVSTGRPLMGIPIETPGNVLILSVEDDLPILRGRIEANNGDLDKCHFMANAAGLTFNSPEVEQAVKQIGAKMVIFDPFQAFLGANVNMDKSNQTRPELAKLFQMSDRNDCSIAIIAHMGKFSMGNSAVNRSLGSVDIPAAMRNVLQIIKNPENEFERIVVQIKCSNEFKGRSIAYTIGDRGGVQWNGFSPMTEEDLNTVVKRKEKGIPYENEPLVKVFNQMITDKPGGGFWAYEELKSIGMKILGFPPFSTTSDLKHKLDGPLSRELQEHDGLIVTHSQRGSKGVRGIRIEQYQHPQGYQISLDMGNESDDKS